MRNLSFKSIRIVYQANESDLERLNIPGIWGMIPPQGEKHKKSSNSQVGPVKVDPIR